MSEKEQGSIAEALNKLIDLFTAKKEEPVASEEEVVETDFDPLDKGINGMDASGSTITNDVEVGRYYILNIKDQCDLTNGFRYIKELLYQYHNFKIYNDFNKLQNAGINVYSVKTDAFTIQKTDLESAQQVLQFDKGVLSYTGSWTKEV